MSSGYIPSSYSNDEVLRHYGDRIPDFLLVWVEGLVDKANDYDRDCADAKEVTRLESEISSLEDEVSDLEQLVSGLNSEIRRFEEMFDSLETA